METLTKRDIAVVKDVYAYRYLTIHQIVRLHFPSIHTAYRRLQRLTELGLIKTFTVPHIPGRVFYIAKPGAELIAEDLGVEVAELSWFRYAKTPKDYYFLRHFLAINDFQILITKTGFRQPFQKNGHAICP